MLNINKDGSITIGVKGGGAILNNKNNINIGWAGKEESIVLKAK